MLICPDCQSAPDWSAELDACPSCGSTALVRTLGETGCRSCGATVTESTGSTTPAVPAAPGLSEEVDAALERLRLPGEAGRDGPDVR